MFTFFCLIFITLAFYCHADINKCIVSVKSYDYNFTGIFIKENLLVSLPSRKRLNTPLYINDISMSEFDSHIKDLLYIKFFRYKHNCSFPQIYSN